MPTVLSKALNVSCRLRWRLLAPMLLVPMFANADAPDSVPPITSTAAAQPESLTNTKPIVGAKPADAVLTAIELTPDITPEAEPVIVTADDWGLCQAWPKPPLRLPGPAQADSETYLSADRAEAIEQSRYKLDGGVLVEQAGVALYADRAEYFASDERVEASGNIEYFTDGLGARGDSLTMTMGNNHGRLDNSQYFVYQRHARGSSRELRFEGPEYTVMRQATYTSCDPGNEDWLLRASTVELDRAEGVGAAYNARLSFKGVPFMYTPYISFPIDDRRKSGLLYPSFGTSDDSGTMFEIPIYLNFHPQFDMTLTPRNFTARGLQTESEARYLSPFGTSIAAYETLDDQLYGEERDLVNFSHRGNVGAWRAAVIYSSVSDKDYYQDFSNNLGVSSTTHLDRHVTLSRGLDLGMIGQGSITALAQDYYTVDTTIAPASQPYRRLPQLQLDVNGPTRHILDYGLNSEFVRFQRQDRLGANRLDLSPRLSLPFERRGGFIRPELIVRHSQYQLDPNTTNADETNLSRTVPIAILDSGIFLERDAILFGTPFVQTLEPRLYYAYIPYRDQQALPRFDTSLRGFSSSSLFQADRFNGPDRIGDTEQVSLSISQRLIDLESGRELASATVGQIYYLRDRLVTLGADSLDQTTHSDVIIEAKLSPSEPWRFKADMLWDPDYDIITRRNLHAQYASDNHHIVNLIYRDSGNRRLAPQSVSRQIDSSVLWPITHRWSIIARRYHSLNDKRTIEKMAGLEYGDCCWAFRFLRRAEHVAGTADDLNWGWSMQLELRGFANLGQPVTELMEEGIIGFRAAK